MASTIVRTTSEAPRSPSGGPHDAGGSGSSGAAEPLSNQPTNSLLHARLGQFTPVSRQTHGHTPTDARRPVFLACQWGGVYKPALGHFRKFSIHENRRTHIH